MARDMRSSELKELDAVASATGTEIVGASLPNGQDVKLTTTQIAALGGSGGTDPFLPAGPSGWTLIEDAPDYESGATARLMEIPLALNGAGGFATVYQCRFEGDDFPRFVLVSDGSYYIGDGTENPVDGGSAVRFGMVPSLGGDPDDVAQFIVGINKAIQFASDGKPSFPSGVNVGNGSFVALTGLVVDYGEISDPPAPDANTARVYARDSGGKTQLCVRFPTGAVQVLATEP